MAIPIRQNTADQKIPLGYFLDSSNGDDEETLLNIANTDIKLWKYGATTLANKNSGGATHMANGLYYCVLDATDSSILGGMVVFVHVAGALAVRVECEVMTANRFDALVLGTDVLHADVTQWLGTAAAAPNTAGVPKVDVTQLDGSAVALDDLVDFATDGYNTVTNKVAGVELVDVTTTNTDMRGTDGANTVVPDAAGTGPNVLIDTTISGAPSSQTVFVLAAGSDIDDAYKDQAIVLYDASNNDYPSVRKVSDYTGASKTITLDSAPDFTIVAGDGVKTFVTSPGTTAPTVGQIRAEMEGAGYFLDLIKDDTNELQGDWVNDGRLDVILDIIAADTTTDIPALIADVPTVAEFNARTLPTSDYIVVADILDAAIEGAYTMREMMRVATAVMAGASSGAGTGTMVFRDLNDIKDRVTATLTEDGDRTTVVINAA